MQNLLSSGPRPDQLGGSQRGRSCRGLECHITLLETQERVLAEIQANLREYSIAAEIPEIVSALIDAATTRPDLCRALMAAYLLEPNL